MTKHDILQKYFGYPSFREGQEFLADGILSGQDVLGIMPTGAGKSICYQVPALLMPGITLVISPLISLMKDQVHALNQAGIHAAFINSSLTEGQIAKALTLAAQGHYKIIYVAPERLETASFMQFALGADISMVAVDEAHCISQWGQDFRPSYLNIVQFVKNLPKRPVLSAFTATATEEVKEDIVCVLGLEHPKILVTGFDRKNLYFAVEHTKQKDGFVLDYVTSHAGDSGIIYCATRKNVEAVYDMLASRGVAVTKYHAGLSASERRQNQDDFIYDTKPVVVATNAFGMGIDKSNVRYVLHYNMPQSMENYYQEAGRAGRDGEESECILLYSAQDLMVNRYLLDSKEMNPQFSSEEARSVRERDEQRLQAINFYCNTTDCLRTYILRYFGENRTEPCGHCGNCQKEFIETDVTEEGKLILECVQELRQRYGINVVAGTLLGANTAKLREYGVDKCQTYGALSKWKEKDVKEVISLMVREGLLRQTQDKYALVRLTGDSHSLRDGSRKLIRKTLEEEEQTYQQPGKVSANRRSDILNSKGLAFFDSLRELRAAIAREESLPPYLIFSDKTLVDMCVKLPMNREELLTVSGVGEFKCNKYGQRFLNRILEHTGGVPEKYYFGDERSAAQAEPVKRREKDKDDFSITNEMAGQIQYMPNAYLGDFVASLNALRDEQTMKRLTVTGVQSWLQAEGYTAFKLVDGKNRERPTDKGEQAGITVGTRISAKGNEYETLCYGEEIEKIIVDQWRKD